MPSPLRTYTVMLSILFLCLSLLLSSCRSVPLSESPPPLSSINIIDRNGMSETISNTDRLKKFEDVNFLSPQPYQKVLRVHARDQNGNVQSYITSYHPNGQPKQFLEVVNNRAFGSYCEWYANGQLKIEATVIGGNADLNTAAEQTWLFEGYSRAWNEEGQLLAEIQYCKGELEGYSIHYHSNGQVWKKFPYHKNLVSGTAETFLATGELFQTSTFINGVKEGASQRFWCSGSLAADEFYECDLLINATYYDINGNVVSQICEGEGHRAVFGKEELCEIQEYHHGRQEGLVKVFAKTGTLARTYHVKNNVKHGEEVEYQTNKRKGEPLPLLSMSWNNGRLQGLVKTWYTNGTMESQRELSNNTKHGLLTAWYKDGNLMMIEEYDQDKLVKGEYYKKGERVSISQVIAGKGTATLHDPDGNFIRRVTYLNGKPQE